MKTLRQVALSILAALALVSLAPSRAQSADEREQALKAGFIYNFFSYVQWPQKANDPADSPFVVGIVAEDLYNPLQVALQGKTIKNRRIEVRKIDNLNDLSAYHLIFISASEDKKTREILERTKSLPVLTVGEVSGFAKDGGVINLVPARNRIQLEINLDAAEKAGLTISSQLYKLAKIVKS